MFSEKRKSDKVRSATRKLHSALSTQITKNKEEIRN